MACIEWQGALTPDGYPRRLYKGNANTRWHRVVCAKSRGLSLDDISEQVVRHTCDNPKCVNPEHLLLGTPADNMNDRDRRDRHGHQKVTRAEAVSIVAELEAGTSVAALTERYGISRSAVYYQKRRLGG